MSCHEAASAGRFVREARAVLGLPAVDEEASVGASQPTGLPRSLPFLVCGGSGFYLHALLHPVDPSLRASADIREQVLQVEEEQVPRDCGANCWPGTPRRSGFRRRIGPG
jgi:hypothetical protein